MDIDDKENNVILFYLYCKNKCPIRFGFQLKKIQKRGSDTHWVLVLCGSDLSEHKKSYFKGSVNKSHNF